MAVIDKQTMQADMDALGGTKFSRKLMARWSLEQNNELAEDIMQEIKAALRYEIVAENSQSLLHGARAGREIYTTFRFGGADRLTQMIDNVVYELDDDTTIILSPTAFTIMLTEGVLTNVTFDNKTENFGLKLSATLGQTPVYVDQYAREDTPVLIGRTGWFSYVGDNYLGEEVNISPGFDPIHSFTTDLTFTYNADNYRLIGVQV